MRTAVNRRALLRCAVAGTLAGNTGARPASAVPLRARFKAIAFDGFPILDARGVAQAAERVFPEGGAALMAAWRTRQFEYQWLRALAGRYVDFERATEDSLVAAARSLKLELSAQQRAALMAPYSSLGIWPEVPAALERLHEAGLRMVFLSNLTAAMIDRAVAGSALAGFFEPPLSTDRVRSYKPDPRAYRLALEALRLPREEILFVASAGWDAAGAKWFGYPTYWVNRQAASADELGVVPDGSGPDLNALVEFVLPRSS